MKKISEITTNRLFQVEKGTEKITSERQLIIKDFTDKINLARKRNGYKTLAPRVIAIKLGHIKNDFDLKWFYKKCDQSNNFCKTFWGMIKCK